MLLKADGSILTTVADTTYATVAKTRLKAKMELLYERWSDNITGFCDYVGDVILKRVSIKDINWDFESKNIEVYKKYELSEKDFYKKAKADLKAEFDIQKTIIKSDFRKWLKGFLFKLHNNLTATYSFMKDLTTIEK